MSLFIPIDTESEKLFSEGKGISLAEFFIGALLMNGAEILYLVLLAREIEPPRADFVVCLANGVGNRPDLLRAQAIDELRNEFPLITKCLEANNGSNEHRVLCKSFLFEKN